MANDYFNASGTPAQSSSIASPNVRAEFAGIAAGFDKMPALTGNAYEVAYINASGTAMASVAGDGLLKLSTTGVPTIAAAGTDYTNLAVLSAATAATPNDADLMPVVDADVTKKLSLTNLKAFLKTYFDTIYAAVAGSVSQAFSASSIELGHASDTTLTRVSAGVVAVEGSNVLLASGLGSITQAYDADIPTVSASQGEMEAGTEAALRSMSPLRVAQAIAALGGSFDPASPGAIGGTTPAAITATTLKHIGAMDSQAVRYAGDATYHREAEITKTFNPGASAAIDVATAILSDDYSAAIVTVEAMGMTDTGTEVICIARRTVKMVGNSPTFTTVGTDTLSYCTIGFSYVATRGFKATITNSVAQQCYGGMKMSVVGGGGDAVDGGITSLT